MQDAIVTMVDYSRLTYSDVNKLDCSLPLFVSLENIRSRRCRFIYPGCHVHYERPFFQDNASGALRLLIALLP